MALSRVSSTRMLVATAAIAVLAGCTTVRTPTKGDPLEGLNRTVFAFNDKVDQAVLRPTAQAYVKIVPQGARNGVSNFFSNVGDVYIAANNLMQGKITAGTEDVMRVVINTVFGLGGLFDVATQARLPKHQNDFGLTLAHYGVPAGPYLILPLLGPSTLRDSAGFLVDRQLDPTSYIGEFWVSATLYGVRIISARAGLLGTTDLLTDAALDKYSFIRNAYLQRRAYLSNDGVAPALPKYDDEPSSGPTPAGGGAGTGGTAALQATPVPAGSGAAAASSASGTAAVPVPSANGASSVAPAGAAAPASGTSGTSVAAPLSGPNAPPGETDDTVVPAQQMLPPVSFPGFRLR